MQSCCAVIVIACHSMSQCGHMAPTWCPHGVHMVSLFIHIAADVNHVERQAEHQGLQESGDSARRSKTWSYHVKSSPTSEATNLKEKNRNVGIKWNQ